MPYVVGVGPEYSYGTGTVNGAEFRAARERLCDIESPMKCRCLSQAHGHPIPCRRDATEADQLCRDCHQKAASGSAATGGAVETAEGKAIAC